MKEFVEFVGFGSILQIIVFVISLVWYGSRYGFRIENLEKDSNEQKKKNLEHAVETKTVLSELQKIREWQIARDAKESIIADFTKSNQEIIEAIKSLKK